MSRFKDLTQRLLPKGRTTGEESATTRRTLGVEGMSCGHCKAAVEEELGKVEGVRHSEADFGKGTVELRYDESKVTDEDLRNAIQEAGYTLAG